MKDIQQKLTMAYSLLVDADKKDEIELRFAVEEALGFIAEVNAKLEEVY